MKVLHSWLREFAPAIPANPDTETLNEISETLSALGLAVEEVTHTGADLDGIIVAKVLDLRPHPDADKIQLVDVDTGDGKGLQVCCGAFNMTVGDLIPFATIGTVMPNGMEIAQRKMRGELSNGMCCSSAEIGLGDDSDGIMILDADIAELGTPIAQALKLEQDILWDLEVNANRPDAMSVAGIARDLAAALKIDFDFGDYTYKTEKLDTPTTVSIDDPTLCGRFFTRVIKDVTIGQSPAWIQTRLNASGMRPINTIVDISNYVMLELGQPSHTYDLATVPNGALKVRRANAGETLVTLDGKERKLLENDGLICDQDDRPIGMAGVMGGADTEIGDATTDVLLEMAWFDPPSTSRTIKAHNLPSEAATRYRRGIDWGDNMVRAMDRFCQLLVLCAKEKSTPAPKISETVFEATGQTPSREPVEVRVAKINSLCSLALNAKEMAELLSPIGFVCNDATSDAETFGVTVPTWRWDTSTETEIAEEVARMFGYENVNKRVPRSAQVGHLTDYQKARRSVRAALIGAGCDEIFPMPFLAPGELAACGLDEEAVTLTNPLVHEESVLRTSLLPAHLKAIAYNQSHRNGPLRFFEIGTVFLPPKEGELLPDEREYLAVSISESHAASAVEIATLIDSTLALANMQLRDATPAGMHPTRSADVVIAGRPRGAVGEVDPDVSKHFGITGRVAWLQLDLGEILSGPYGNRKYKRVSKFPSSDIDLAFEVPEGVPASKIAGNIAKSGGAELVEVKLFDTYRGDRVTEGTRNLAYRLRFQAHDRTLTDDEVGELRTKCIIAAQKQKGVKLRA